jgi:hypothetical protein
MPIVELIRSQVLSKLISFFPILLDLLEKNFFLFTQLFNHFRLLLKSELHSNKVYDLIVWIYLLFLFIIERLKVSVHGPYVDVNFINELVNVRNLIQFLLFIDDFTKLAQILF